MAPRQSNRSNTKTSLKLYQSRNKSMKCYQRVKRYQRIGVTGEILRTKMKYLMNSPIQAP